MKANRTIHLKCNSSVYIVKFRYFLVYKICITMRKQNVISLYSENNTAQTEVLTIEYGCSRNRGSHARTGKEVPREII